MGLAASTTKFKVGVAVTASFLEYGSPNLLKFVEENFNLFTAASGFDLLTVCPNSPTEFDWTDADFMVNYTAGKYVLRAHPLVWNQSLIPSWLTKETATKAALTNWISTIVGRYKGKVNTWTVVNEPFVDNAWATGPWYDSLTQQYVWEAFDAAHAADPAANLLINFNHTEHASEISQRAAVIDLLTTMKKQKVPCDHVGIESHIDASVAINIEQLQNFIKEIVGLGYKIHITELDVNDAKVKGSTAFRDAAVADLYKNYLDWVLPYADIDQLIFWSPTDYDNWMNPLCAAGVQEYVSVNGDCSLRPGLTDTSYQIKSCYNSVLSAISS